ncbi:class I SAM-dependent methyltransferase [Thermodesulfatator autotrophicus]|uniref:Methyltransferase type 12 n=1 Tax=Thermodesulfatator autotrophicus TaxID=1795632 RepID=A0A177E8I6_9BACT|nr:class I SAM-dependent methyltransferase [Thermodesulfatator autotrophicus]OAG27532.1 methyltransferase type 12 [Thermodesulfatator autotrophicus]
MERILEPELMLDDEQAKAYASADFSAPHQMFVDLFQKIFGPDIKGVVLDLGCGPADISVRFAKAYPDCLIHGVDGSPAMLKYGQQRIEQEKLTSRIKLILGKIPEVELPQSFYDAVIVNSLLHHLPDPLLMWETIKEVAKPQSPILVMDLLRPESPEKARKLVEKYAANEPEVLKKDFYHSLLAGFTPEEINKQLKAQDLSHFKVEVITDRHFIVYGYL